MRGEGGEEARGKNSVYVLPKKENEPIKYKDNDILKFSHFEYKYTYI
jgi:hypothetical protein